MTIHEAMRDFWDFWSPIPTPLPFPFCYSEAPLLLSFSVDLSPNATPFLLKGSAINDFHMEGEGVVRV